MRDRILKYVAADSNVGHSMRDRARHAVGAEREFGSGAMGFRIEPVAFVVPKRGNRRRGQLDGSRFRHRPIGMVGLGRLLWSRGGGPGGSDQIEIFGFDGVYGSAGQIVTPGDSVTVTLWNPDNGAAATKSFTAPAAANFAGFNTPPNMTVGEVFQVTGRIMDSQGCTVETGPITWAPSAGSFSS